jgi:hypothetical protein
MTQNSTALAQERTRLAKERTFSSYGVPKGNGGHAGQDRTVVRGGLNDACLMAVSEKSIRDQLLEAWVAAEGIPEGI